MNKDKKLIEQIEMKNHDEKGMEFCPNCNKPMWKYIYVGGAYFYCSFCHLRKGFVRR